MFIDIGETVVALEKEIKELKGYVLGDGIYLQHWTGPMVAAANNALQMAMVHVHVAKKVLHG